VFRHVDMGLSFLDGLVLSYNSLFEASYGLRSSGSVRITWRMSTHQRANIVIDEDLMPGTLAETRLKPKREAVDLGLRTLLRLNRQCHMREPPGERSSEWAILARCP